MKARKHKPKHGEDEEAAEAHGKLKGAGSLAMGGPLRECEDCIVIRTKSRRERKVTRQPSESKHERARHREHFEQHDNYHSLLDSMKGGAPVDLNMGQSKRRLCAPPSLSAIFLLSILSSSFLLFIFLLFLFSPFSHCSVIFARIIFDFHFLNCARDSIRDSWRSWRGYGIGKV